jgi:hypothetical protein
MSTRIFSQLFRATAVFACLGLATLSVRAQVPQLISYQGRIRVAATNFDGAGQFKFALVSSNAVTTFWSNDGSSFGGGQPLQGMTLTVSKGLYSVLLGDTAVSNMTAIPSTVFTNSDVRLRIWFNDGVTGFQLLAPDQRIAPVAYAMMAANISDGAIVGSKIVAGAIGTSKLADNAVAVAKTAAASVLPYNLAGGQYVPSGGMILSSNANDGFLLGAGYVKLRKVTLSDGSSMYLFLKP